MLLNKRLRKKSAANFDKMATFNIFLNILKHKKVASNIMENISVLPNNVEIELVIFKYFCILRITRDRETN